MSSHSFGTSKEKVTGHVEEVQIGDIDDEKLLSITIDEKLSFKKHIQTLCKKS